MPDLRLVVAVASRLDLDLDYALTPDDVIDLLNTADVPSFVG